MLSRFLRLLFQRMTGSVSGRDAQLSELSDPESLKAAIAGLGAEMEIPLSKQNVIEIAPGRESQGPVDELACVRQAISKNEMIDEEMIRQICQYDDGSHGDTLTELISLFLQITPKRIESLKRALEERKWSTLSKEAHSLKSSSANLGLKKVTAVCRKLEAIDHHPDFTMASSLLSEVEKEYQAAAQSLMDLLKRRVPARKTAA